VVYHRHKQIGVVVTSFFLQYRCDSFKAGAGVDVISAQRRKFAVVGAIILNEDKIPQFDETGAAGIDATLVAFYLLHITTVGAKVDMNLAAGSTRAGLAHFPEVIFPAECQNSLSRYRSYLCPQLLCLFVFGQGVVFASGENRRP